MSTSSFRIKFTPEELKGHLTSPHRRSPVSVALDCEIRPSGGVVSPASEALLQENAGADSKLAKALDGWASALLPYEEDLFKWFNKDPRNGKKFLLDAKAAFQEATQIESRAVEDLLSPPKLRREVSGQQAPQPDRSQKMVRVSGSGVPCQPDYAKGWDLIGAIRSSDINNWLEANIEGSSWSIDFLDSFSTTKGIGPAKITLDVQPRSVVVDSATLNVGESPAQAEVDLGFSITVDLTQTTPLGSTTTTLENVARAQVSLGADLQRLSIELKPGGNGTYEVWAEPLSGLVVSWDHNVEIGVFDFDVNEAVENIVATLKDAINGDRGPVKIKNISAGSEIHEDFAHLFPRKIHFTTSPGPQGDSQGLIAAVASTTSQNPGDFRLLGDTIPASSNLAGIVNNGALMQTFLEGVNKAMEDEWFHLIPGCPATLENRSSFTKSCFPLYTARVRRPGDVWMRVEQEAFRGQVRVRVSNWDPTGWQWFGNNSTINFWTRLEINDQGEIVAATTIEGGASQDWWRFLINPITASIQAVVDLLVKILVDIFVDMADMSLGFGVAGFAPDSIELPGHLRIGFVAE